VTSDGRKRKESPIEDKVAFPFTWSGVRLRPRWPDDEGRATGIPQGTVGQREASPLRDAILEDTMKVGSRVELKATGEQGRLASFDYHLMAPICTVILDDGREIKAMLLEVKSVRDRKKKEAELRKQIRKGGDE